MSIVTGVMLICSTCDDGDLGPLSEIAAWLAERESSEGNWRLADTSDHAVGGKHPQFATFCGGFNAFCLEEDEFAAFVMSRDWTFPENLVLIMQPEDGETRVFRPKSHAVVCVAGVPEAPPMKSVGPGAPIPEGWAQIRR